MQWLFPDLDLRSWCAILLIVFYLLLHVSRSLRRKDTEPFPATPTALLLRQELRDDLLQF
jgi:hypothetical protein